MDLAAHVGKTFPQCCDSDIIGKGQFFAEDEIIDGHSCLVYGWKRAGDEGLQFIEEEIHVGS
jgi:hypothetical protein